MKFTVIVSATPDSAFSLSALQFCKALTNTDHSLHCLFFVGRGALNCINTGDAISQQWSSWLSETKQEALCCAAAMKKLDINVSQIHDRASVAGLGQLIAASMEGERCVTFGSRD